MDNGISERPPSWRAHYRIVVELCEMLSRVVPSLEHLLWSLAIGT
jgi:hypothetical protein